MISVRLYTINPDQDKYQLLNEYNEFSENEGMDSIFEKLPPEYDTPVEELEGNTNKVIIFDGIKIDNHNMNNIKEYFPLSRNKNCNCIYLTQSYYDVSKYIRRNTKCLFCLVALIIKT